jgi:hypothetical protein
VFVESAKTSPREPEKDKEPSSHCLWLRTHVATEKRNRKHRARFWYSSIPIWSIISPKVMRAQGHQNRPKETRTSPSKLAPKLVPLRDMAPLFAFLQGRYEGPSLVPPQLEPQRLIPQRTTIRAATLCSRKARPTTADPRTFCCRRIP